MDISASEANTPSTPAPSLTVYGDQSEILGDNQFALGDTVTAQLRVKSVADDDAGRSVGFELVSLAPSAPAEPEIPGLGPEGSDDVPDEELGLPEAEPEIDEEGDAAEESVLGYKRPKVKRPAPKLSAKDLQE
jgi:hypothetical protein